MARLRSKAWRKAFIGMLLLPIIAASQAMPAHAATISDPAITESTGLAYDANRGVYWTANRTGSTGYAISQDGATVATIDLAVSPQDVEAISMRNNTLYLADIGDPQTNRDHVSIYWTDEISYGYQSPISTWNLIYPDGPHDAKAFAISPRGNLYIITFGAPGGLYMALTPPYGDATLQLERVADAPNYVTDMAFFDNLSLAVRSYNSVQILDSMNSFTPTASTTIPDQPQGESLAVAWDGVSLILGSVGANSDLSMIDTPTVLTDIPEALASPPGAIPAAIVTPTPSDEQSPTSQPSVITNQTSGDDSNNVNSNTTVIALVLAGVLSVSAGLFVYLRTKPKSVKGGQ